MASYLHRTATTAYPCFGQDLGDSAGAGRIRLAGANLIKQSNKKAHNHGIPEIALYSQ
jgi:hypothetical protein